MSGILDIELVHPARVVPEGTTFAVRHFLSVPSCQEVEEVVKGGGRCHSILKVTKGMKKKLDMEVVHSEGNISGPYISTEKFQGKCLCRVLVAWVPWGSEKAECRHPSLKEIVITKHKDVCGHQPNALAVYCHCEAAESDFKELLKKRSHEPTEVVMRQNIEKRDTISYNLVIKLQGSEQDEEERTVSHLTLCKNNGVVQLGEAIQSQFDCTCKSSHCGRHKQISIAATHSVTGQVDKFSNILLCDKSKCGGRIQPNQGLGEVHPAPESSAAVQTERKLTLKEIMEEEIVRPHRSGEDLFKLSDNNLTQILHNTLLMSLGLERTLTYGSKITG